MTCVLLVIVVRGSAITSVFQGVCEHLRFTSGRDQGSAIRGCAVTFVLKVIEAGWSAITIFSGDQDQGVFGHLRFTSGRDQEVCDHLRFTSDRCQGVCEHPRFRSDHGQGVCDHLRFTSDQGQGRL
jgi:hypothetical protein